MAQERIDFPGTFWAVVLEISAGRAGPGSAHQYGSAKCTLFSEVLNINLV